MKILSSAFQDGQEIPTKYTCEGEDISPPLSWEDVPGNTKSLALIVEDPDAPDPKAPKMVWIHWVLFNIDPKSKGIPENAMAHELPKDSQQGLTSWKKTNYGGPCPPIGRHRYYHRLYALDLVFSNVQNPTADTLRQIMRDHVIAEAVIMGTYQKSKG